jgi:transposase-like protein
MTTRPAIFKWRQTEPQLILCAVRWYLRYSLSLRDVEELLEERGKDVRCQIRFIEKFFGLAI